MLRQGNVCGPAGDGSDFDRELSPAKLGPVRMSGSVKGPKARKNLAFWEIKSGAVWPDEEKVAKRGKDWRSEGEAGGAGPREPDLSPQPPLLPRPPRHAPESGFYPVGGREFGNKKTSYE